MNGLDHSQLNTAAAERAKVFHAGANWFFWIAGLSVVNSLVVVFEGEWSFIIGLGITQIVDAIAMVIADEASGSAATIIKFVAFAFNAFVALLFVMFGWFARKRQSWAFLVGITLRDAVPLRRGNRAGDDYRGKTSMSISLRFPGQADLVLG